MRSMLLFSVVVMVLAVGDRVARADIAPSNQCGSPGQPCQNAGTAYNQAGTCVTTTCTEQVFAADGGLVPMTYSCFECLIPGTAGNGGGTSGSAGTGAGGVGGTTHTSSGSSGCSVVRQERAGVGAAPFGLVVAGLVAARLRRRRTSVR
jgi:hypothetical protein